MLKKIKFYFIMDCVVFTIMSLVLNLVYILLDIVENINQSGYVTLTMQYLSATTVISILFFCLDKCNVKNDICNHLLALIIVVSTIFGLGGGVYHWFPLFSWYSLMTLGIIIVIYCSVYFLLFARNIEASHHINKKLQEIQEVEYNEKNY